MARLRLLSDCRLYTFIDTAYTRGRSVEDLARQLCDGGSDVIQLRAKNLEADEVLGLARRIRLITDEAGVLLAVNDHWTAAVEAGAALCHLGQEDFFEAGWRRVEELAPLGGAVKLGLSSHAPDQAERAVKAGAAYLGVGPVYRTGTKPAARPVTLDYVRWASDHLLIPWFAIGGITLENLDEVLAAGARRVCVVSAILNAPDVVRACQTYRDRLSSAP
ncbi:MAG TPA: thiamine phosphate synthase [Candidatus Paceibacterota bacterium]|nr:thiamine phosphate synthase [Verrucomicrobiota bacterium]HRY46647.1 thiamine phosphate synthase [Candidatus Paceibacterota bacterium]